MSVQIFLSGKLVGIEPFLLAASDQMEGRSHWVSLLSEVLPRALLKELGLAPILLGSSGGEQFLVALPAESRIAADEFLRAAQKQIDEVSAGCLKLLWSFTENLGDWSDVRKRLNEEMQWKLGAPAMDRGPATFEGFVEQPADYSSYFTDELGGKLRETNTVSWSPDAPALIRAGEGKHTWALGASLDGISYARHTAPNDDGSGPASFAELAARSDGRKTWGVLRGDVDTFGTRIRRATNIQEHIQLSVMFKQFFAGELEMQCSLPDFWRKVTLLYSGGDDFAVYGTWDALIALAREVHRLFQRFAQENLKDFPGPEGKTITMALALARDDESTLPSVFEEAGQNLETAKASGKDCFYLFGRTLEWKAVGDASDTRSTMTRMIREFSASPQFLYELADFYREASVRGPKRSRNDRLERPWRFHRRLNTVLGQSRNKEFQRLRADLISDFTGRRAAQIRLRPAGRVALEWAKLEIEAE